MIKTDVLFDSIDDISCAWVPNGTDVPELARISDLVIAKNMQYLSLPVGAVDTVWPWVEQNSVKILTRVNFANDATGDVAMSQLATNIMDAFRHGASGVQVFVHYDDITEFVDMMLPMRDDLFFERYLSVAMNIKEVPNNKWPEVFALLDKMRPNSILIIADGDSFLGTDVCDAGTMESEICFACYIRQEYDAGQPNIAFGTKNATGNFA